MKKSEQRALALLVEAGIEEPPVPVEELARARGAWLEFEPLDDEMSGMLYRDGERAIIGINSAHPKTRQRFSIAHELGHLLLHQGRPIFVDKLVRINLRDTTSGLGLLSEEVEANSFAAALLMPEAFVSTAIGRSLRQDGDVNGEELIRDLARRFDVSPQAMEYRLTNLGIAVVR